MPKEERPFYEFTHLICLSTCFKSAPSLSSPKETSVEKRSRKKGGKSAQVDCKDRMDGAADPSNKLDETLGFPTVFANFEDEIYLRNSCLKFCYPTSRTVLITSPSNKPTRKVRTKRGLESAQESQDTFNEKCPEYRLVYVVKFDQVESIVSAIEQLPVE
eukprot:GHVQ01023758.1.p3 GENE.GHVQ01023758.1~~GHVQ01023758.1.p3  ORF type:complete len:160 (-),score=22.52 GHVQ01023758.1:355-834(-)